MAHRSTTSRPSSWPGSPSAGHTLIEVLVALTMAAAILGAVLTLTVSGQRAYGRDRDATESRRGFHGALAILGADVREAGRWLPGDFPAIQLIDGGAGPDELVLRHAATPAWLSVCEDLTAGDSDAEIVVVDPSAGPAGCRAVGDADANGVADDVQRWRALRVARGGALRAYLWNPATASGEWFVSDSDGSADNEIGRDSSEAWGLNHAASERPRVYHLNEVRYRIESGVLVRESNGSGTPVPVAAGVDTFEAIARRVDGSTAAAWDGTQTWVDLASLEIALTGTPAGAQRTVAVTSTFSPRGAIGRE